MASRNMQINLQFNANIQNAKTQLQSLQTQLNNLINSNTTSTSLGITPQIQEATRSAMDLKIALNNAMNVNTGKLNLNKFQSELNRMGKDIGYFAQQMGRLGPEGVKAFTQVASAVAQADIKLFSLQGGMKKLANTFMNTVRWQVTSQAIMAVTGAISETVSYAKELDTSLNNIRIVTGKSADQMATFAKQANNAAKALSTSTTKYTDASLIYYQQGLNDRAVKERTDVTVKLANVVGESAETVSEWMTAIWNNFDDGSEKLEYYADVLAKLGAATASSADEIAGGLEKFAAVAETIGLSYEYAASALATITAETRQSEDVVGTALKTILSRMEQLKQGDTLEDGTTLGQYSLALQKVGVDIKDASGELKDMDIILEQTGTRWETLGRDQQIALAQQVAGIRQYTQFMALMDNWDVMEKNLELTEQANGALTEQQRIYEESTKAAEERMKVAGEAIKATLLGGDDMTKLYDIGAGALEIINELLEAFGGLPTILLAVAAALTKIYQPQVASFMSQMGIAIKDTWTTVRHPIKAIKGENLSTAQQLRMKTVNEGLALAKSDAPYGTATLLEAEADAQKKLIAMENKLSAEAKQRAEWELQILQSKKDQILQSAEEAQIQEELAAKAGSRLEKKYGNDTRTTLTNQAIAQGQVQSHLNIAKDTAQQAKEIYGTKINTEKRQQIGGVLSQELNKVKNSSQDLGISLDNIGFDKLELEVEKFANNGTSNLEKIIKKIETIQQLLSSGKAANPVIDDEVNKKMAAIKQNSKDGQANVTAIDNLQAIDNPDANSSRWTKNRSEKALGEIDKNLGNIKEDKLTSKAAKDKITQWKKESAEIKKLGKNHKEYSKRVGDLIKDIKKHTNVQDKNNKTLRNSYNVNKKMIKSQKDLDQIQENLTKDMKKQQGILAESAEKTETSETNINNLKDSYGDFTNTLNGSNIKLTSWSNFLANGLSSVTSYLMGLSMLSSAFEQIGSSIAKGEGGLTNWISNISSALMSIGLLLPAMTSMSSGIQALTTKKLMENIATSTGITLAKKSKTELMNELAAKRASAKGSEEKAIADAMAALGASGRIVAESWGAAIGVALMAVGLIAPIIGGISSFGSAKTEQKQENVSKGAESLEAINENQELAESVTDLTEEYNALRNAGESTADVLKDMREKIPELIDSYKELAKTMGTHIDTSELEKAYEVFEKTGDTSLLEKAQEKIDKDIKDKKRTTAKTTMDTARELVTEAASSGVGDGYFGNEYGTDLGSISGEDEQIFRDVLGDYYKESEKGIRFSLTDSGELIDAYNGMLKVRSELEKKYSPEELEDLEYYNKLNEEIKEMAENMPDVINAQQALFDIEKEEALADEQAFNSKIGLSSIGSVEEFEANKDKLIKKIQEETEWTTAQAEAYLMATEAYGGYAEAADFFSESGLGFNKDASEQTIKDVKEWFSNLPEEDRTLAMTIDYTTVATKEDAAAALEEARKKAEEAAILQEAEKLEVDEGTFDTYTEGLADLNKELDENENLTKQIALNNLKISKGLTTLTKSWDDNFEIIKRGNKASLEYAEAIGEVKKAFEEMFGVKPSTEYIEQYSDEINEMANGNLDSLQKLQDALAEDYILNMEYKTAINEDWSGTISDAQNQLRGLLDSIDTSIEVGKDSTLSQDYLNQVQNMLDAGVIAEDQLEKLFRAKGFELNITGWKNMPGPVKRIVQTSYKEGDEDNKTTTIIEEQEDIKVPIINGDTSGLKSSQISGTASVATVTKSTDKRVIDTSAAEEKADKAKERRKKLEDELDRYHEINEIIADTERELDKLGKAKDRAFGASKIALMDKEIAKQKELIENNKKLLEEAEKYYQQDRSKLLSNWNVQLDSTGRISNYEEIQQRYINRLNANAGNEKLYEDIEEEYEAFKDAAEKYEESLNKVEEQAEKVNDELDALYEKNLEKIEYKVQIKVDIADDNKAYLDFLMQKVEDDAFAAAEAIGYLGEEASLILDKIKANEEGIAEVERTLAAGEITPEQAVEKMREYRDELVDLNADLLEIRQTVQDKLTEAFEGWNEEIERGITKLEHYGSVLENYKNIIDIVGKDMLGISDETMSNLSKAQIANANNIIRATKAQLDANNSTLEKMRQARAEAEARGDEESVKEWDEQIKIAEEKSQELATTLQEALSNSLQLAADDFALTVEQIADSFSKAVSGIYDDIEDMRDGWDRIQEVADRYLETYEKTYEISKLNRKIQDSIDKTDNIASQKELRDLQNEIYEMTKDGQQLSKYDLEYLQKKYDLLVAEQAFKDAQNAKSVVRLQRDSEGNFGYVYTADQGTVDNAEQNYEDKLYAFQEYTHKMDEELAEMYISVQEQAYERMQAAAEMYGEGTEAFERERQKILEQYNIDMGYITDEYDKLTDRNLKINEDFNAGVADTYEKTFINSIVPQYQSFEQLYDETTTQCEASCARLDEAIILLQQTFDKQLELAGQDLEGFEETANEKLEKVQDDSSTTANKVEDMAGRMNIALNGSGGAIDAVEGFQIAYSDQMKTVRSATDLTIQKVNELIKEYAKLAEAAGKDYTAPDNSGSGTYKDTIGTGSGETGSNKKNTNKTNLNDGTNDDYKGTIYRKPIATKGIGNINWYQFEKNGAWYSSAALKRNRQGYYAIKEDKDIADGTNKVYNGDMTNLEKAAEKWLGKTLELKQDITKDSRLAFIETKGFVDYDKPWYDPNGIVLDIKYLTPGNAYFKLQGKHLNDNKPIWLHSKVLGKSGDLSSKRIAFDTGGYTGNWGPEGRLAMLHQKEIVLNAHDTENFLTAIGIVRDISDQIEKNAIVMQYQNQLANYRASIGNSGETLQQEVHITAEFPNATDHNEIEEAFKNLTNLASQYANRKF